MAEEKAHAEFSASGSSRWLNCPGSIKLSRKAPKPKDSIYAIEGTKAHACLEQLLENCIMRSKAYSFESMISYIKSWRPANLYGWDADMVKNARGAVAWIMMQYFNRGPDTEIRCEAKVSSEPFTMKNQFGTLDAALVEPFGRLTIIDYKYGAGIAVDPYCSQLVYYALAVSHEFHHNFSEVELVVIQPRAYHESGKKVRKRVISVEEMISWERRFRKAVKIALSDKPPLKSGDWCRFCPAAPLCPELVDNNFERAQIAFSKADGIESVPEPRLVKSADIGTMLKAADRLELWISQLREHAFHLLSDGHKIEGYKLVEKRGTRKWKDSEKVMDTFGELAFGDPSILSPAQLEKAIGKDKRSKAFIKKWVSENTVSESSGLTMATDEDKRLAVAGKAEHVFTTIDLKDYR